MNGLNFFTLNLVEKNDATKIEKIISITSAHYETLPQASSITLHLDCR